MSLVGVVGANWPLSFEFCTIICNLCYSVSLFCSVGVLKFFHVFFLKLCVFYCKHVSVI